MLVRQSKALKSLLNSWLSKPRFNKEYIVKNMQFNRNTVRFNAMEKSQHASTFMPIKKQEFNFLKPQKFNLGWDFATPSRGQQRVMFSTSKEEKEIEYLTLIKEKKITLRDVPEKEKTLLLCMEHIEAGGSFSDVPTRFVTEAFCLYIVNRDGLKLEIIPEANQTANVMHAAFRQNGASRAFVKNEELVTDEMDITAVRQTGYALKFIPEKKRTDEKCWEAVKSSSLASEYVPTAHHSEALWIMALEKDGNVHRHVPVEERTQNIYIAAAKGGCPLSDIPVPYRTFEVYVETVRNAAAHLADVPEESREGVIDTITPEVILADNFMAYEYFPKLPKYTGLIKKYLANNETLYVSSFETETEAEVKSFRFQYGNLPQDLAKTICIQKTNRSSNIDDSPEDNIRMIMALRAATQIQSKNLNLILVGHHNGESRILSGMKPQKISELVSTYPVINNIVLMGCNTAKSKVLDEEIAMIHRFGENYKKTHPTENVKSGLIVLSALPEIKTFPDLLARVHLDEAFVLVKTKSVGNTYLIDIKKSNTDKPDFNIFVLSNDDFSKIEKRLTAGKKVAIPKNEKDKYVLRNLEKPLTKQELECLQDVVLNNEVDVIKAEDEKNYPFLSNLTIDEKEMSEKIRPSFLQEVVKEISANPYINHTVNVRGYPKPIYIDTSKEHASDAPEAKLYASNTKLYPPGQHSSAFFSGGDNINREKLKEDMDKNIKKLKSGKVEKDEDTTCKSITVTIKH